MNEDRFKVICKAWKYLFISIFILVLLVFVFGILSENTKGEDTGGTTFTDEADMPINWKEIDITQVTISEINMMGMPQEQITISINVCGNAKSGNFTILIDRDNDTIVDYSATALNTEIGIGKSIDYYMNYEENTIVSYTPFSNRWDIALKIPKKHFANCNIIYIQVVAWAFNNGQYIKDYAPDIFFKYALEFPIMVGYDIEKVERVNLGGNPAIGDVNITMSMNLITIDSWNATVHALSNTTLLFGEVSPIGDTINSTTSFIEKGTIYDVPNEFYVVAAYTSSYRYIGSKWLYPIANRTINGRVTEINSIPIANASVEIINVDVYGDIQIVKTNEDGYFECDVLEGVYDVIVKKEGYKTEKRYNVTSESYLYITMIKLTVKIWGYVFDVGSGYPIVGVKIECKEWITSTLEGGYYCLYVLPGEYVIKYGCEGYFRYEIKVNYSKNTVSRIDVNLEKVPARTCKIIGIVKNSNGESVSNVIINAVDIVRGWSTSTETNGTGYYQLSVYEGAFVVTAHRSLGNYFASQHGILVDEEVEILNFTIYKSPLTNKVGISGWVTDIAGLGIWNAAIYIWDKDEGHFHTVDEPAVRVNETGYFSTSIYPGSFLCLVVAQGFQSIVANITVTEDGDVFPFGNIIHVVMHPLPPSQRIIQPDITKINVAEYIERLRMYYWQDADVTYLRWQVDFVFGNRDGFLSTSEVSVLSVFMPYYKAWFKDLVGKSSENFLKIEGRAYGYSFDELNISMNFTGSIYELSPIEITFSFRMDLVPSIGDKYSFYSIDLVVRNDTRSINYTYIIKINDDYIVYSHDSYSYIEFEEYANESGHYILVEPGLGPNDIGTNGVFSQPCTEYGISIRDTVKPMVVTQNNVYVEQGANFTLNAASSMDNCYEGVVEYNWSVEDGKEGYVEIWDSEQSITLASIEVPGDYNITLVIKDYAGNENSTIVHIKVIDTMSPKVEIICLEHADEDVPMEFVSNTTDNDIEYPFGYTYNWQIFSNETNSIIYQSSQSRFWYVFENPGNYTVVLMVTDQAGNVAEKRVYIRIEDKTPPMIRTLNEMNAEKDKKVRFDALSCSDNVGIASYEWDFGDGDKAYSAEAYHTYRKDGKYKVTLTVRDVNGLSNTTTIMVTVTSPPNYTLLYLSICLAAILAAVCSVVGVNLYRKWKLGGFVVENAMMIYSDGRLISQMSIRDNEGDSDIIASMLTAVQSFMEDSFKNQYNSSGKVGKLEWSGKKILIDKREKFTLVLVVDGYDWDKIHRMLKRTADKIENEYREQLSSWDGNLSDFIGIKAIIASMLIKEGEPKKKV